jgi:hypothetical protein
MDGLCAAEYRNDNGDDVGKEQKTLIPYGVIISEESRTKTAQQN